MNSTITTRDGREIILISQADLRQPICSGERLRAYCHLHRSDHQRSLSISTSGWGYCHSCHRTVLVREHNPEVAERLLQANASCCSIGPSRRERETLHDDQSSKHNAPRDITPLPRQASATAPSTWQEEERTLLLLLEREFRAALFTSLRVKAYLDERCISLRVADQAGVGYVPPEVLEWPALQPHVKMLRRWVDRIVFPLTSPHGRGLIGRSLWQWRPGLDENRHKALLNQPAAPRRWIKTNPAGWFGYAPEEMANKIVLVEGGFDRLALLAAGLPARDVVALVGTAARPSWLVGQVQAVVLALDGDAGGSEAMQRLADQCTRAGLEVGLCPPPACDGWGKDWNERWRRIGPQCIWPLYDSLARVQKQMCARTEPLSQDHEKAAHCFMKG